MARNKLRNLAAGMAVGLASIIFNPTNVQAQAQAKTQEPIAKPHLELDVAYVPVRKIIYAYGNEIKGKLGFGFEAKLSKDLYFSFGGDIAAYLNSNLSEVDYLEKNVEGRIGFKNMELYSSYCLGGSDPTSDLKNILTFGVRFKLGDEPKRNAKNLELNSYGKLDVAYVPFRQQYGMKQSNEVKTAITGNVEADYRNFFIKAGGTERTYENRDEFPNFAMNIQEYDAYASAGYGNLEVYFFQECDHFTAGDFLYPEGHGERDIGARVKF